MLIIIRQVQANADGRVQWEVDHAGVRSLMTIRQIMQVM